MENVVSARRLRKSVLNNIGDIDLNLYDIKEIKTHREKITHESKENDILIKMKTKFLIKLFLCSLILFTIVLSKMFFLDDIKNNQFIMRWYNHYVMDFSRECMLGKIEYRAKKLNVSIGNVIPGNIKTYVKDEYYNLVKPYILKFELQDAFSNLINLKNKEENNIQQNASETISDKNIGNENEADAVETIAKNESSSNNIEVPQSLTGIGGGEPLDKKTEEAMSSISIMSMDVELIKSKGISIIKPVNGVITSKYGVRDEIFAGVNPYHTGIDIANNQGTVISSATKGIVTKVVYNDKYYGNYVEVTENGVTFKYGHLSSINVKQGNNINQKDKIGLMGSTGMSTGPHLHFEIKVNARTVDPEELLKF